jgi:hypothetical protein
MDLLISMKAETIQKGLELPCNIMQMPTAQSQGYFVAEFREADQEKLRLLRQYGSILAGKLDGNNFLVEPTTFGIVLKKKVDPNIDYMKAWEKWVLFSRMMYDELMDVVGE